jgi:hypothetical protein
MLKGLIQGMAFVATGLPVVLDTYQRTHPTTEPMMTAATIRSRIGCFVYHLRGDFMSIHSFVWNH